MIVRDNYDIHWWKLLDRKWNWHEPEWNNSMSHNNRSTPMLWWANPAFLLLCFVSLLIGFLWGIFCIFIKNLSLYFWCFFKTYWLWVFVSTEIKLKVQELVNSTSDFESTRRFKYSGNHALILLSLKMRSFSFTRCCFFNVTDFWWAIKHQKLITPSESLMFHKESVILHSLQSCSKTEITWNHYVCWKKT